MKAPLLVRAVAVLTLGVALPFACKVPYEVDPNFDEDTGSDVDAGGGSTGGAGNGGDNGGSTGGASDGGSGTGGSIILPTCDPGGFCLAPAPTDWLGPVARDETIASESPSCAGTSFPILAVGGFADLNEGTVACECTCGDPPGMACAAGLTGVHGSTITACTATGTPFSISGCTPLNATTNYYNVNRPAWSSTGTCPKTETVNVPTPSWNSKVVTCSATPLDGGCAGADVCLPGLDAGLDAYCIYREGEFACPVGSPYSSRSLLRDGFQDGRGCSACTCINPTGQCSGEFFIDTSCSATINESSIPFGGCAQVPGGRYGTRGIATPTGSCTAAITEPTGVVAYPGTTTTLCCVP